MDCLFAPVGLQSLMGHSVEVLIHELEPFCMPGSLIISSGKDEEKDGKWWDITRKRVTISSETGISSRQSHLSPFSALTKTRLLQKVGNEH